MRKKKQDKQPSTIFGTHLESVIYSKIGVKSELADELREVLSKLHTEGISVDFLSKSLGYSKIFLMLNLSLKRPKDMSKKEFYGKSIEDKKIDDNISFIFAEDFEIDGENYVSYLLENSKTFDYYVLTVKYMAESREIASMNLIASMEEALVLVSLTKEGKPIGKTFDSVISTLDSIKGFVSNKIKTGVAEELD